jgi:NAD(P)H-dependent FMN reductase
MSEAREVAVTLLPWYRAILGSTKSASTVSKAMRYIRERMRNETETVMDNVAWELHQLAKGDA